MRKGLFRLHSVRNISLIQGLVHNKSIPATYLELTSTTNSIDFRYACYYF